MNWSFVTGILVVASGVWTVFDKAFGIKIPLWNMWAFSFVLGGTLGLALIAIGWHGTREAVHSLLTGVWTKKKYRGDDVVTKLTTLAQAHRDHDLVTWDALHLDEYTSICKEVIKDAVVEPSSRKNIFQTKLQVLQDGGVRRALQLRHLGHYPVSIGLINIVIACFALSWLSLQAAQTETVLSILGFGFLSVVYGLFVSHLWVYPTARRLFEQTQTEHFYHQMIMHGFQLINQRANPIQVTEELNAYLEKQASAAAHGEAQEAA